MKQQLQVGDIVKHNSYHEKWGLGRVSRVNLGGDFTVEVIWEKTTPSYYRLDGTQESKRVRVTKLTKLHKALL